ncbi:MAG: PP2C family protein-serine/threonine phosphatase [Gemmataceae bacterium]
MTHGLPATILLCTDEADGAADVARIMHDLGLSVTRHVWSEPEPAELPHVDLVLLDAGRRLDDALTWCQQRRARWADTPVVFLLQDADATRRGLCFEVGAKACLSRPFLMVELSILLTQWLQHRHLPRRLAEKTAELSNSNQRLHQYFQHSARERELTGRLQHLLQVRQLPNVPNIRWAVSHRPSGHLGGDSFGGWITPDQQLVLYLADVVADGLTAGLLTLFLRQWLAQQMTDFAPAPAQLLNRLNRALLELDIAGSPMISLSVLGYRHGQGDLTIARAGHAPLLYVPRQGEACFSRMAGPLLGLFATEYPTETHTLRPGDRVLLATDGWYASETPEPRQEMDRLREHSQRLRGFPVAEWVERLAVELAAAINLHEDATLIGLERSS